MAHETYLGQKGYSIYKKSLSIKEQISLRKELMVKAYIPNSQIQMEPYPVYLESPKKFYIPRFYGINTFGIPNKLKLPEGLPINLEFKGELRPYQTNIVDKYISYVTNNPDNKVYDTYLGGGLLDIPCGAGKTVMAIKIMGLLKKKTLVIVHKGFLLDQWIERINEFMPDARIGKIQGQVIDIEDKDIVIGMLQSLSMKEYPDDQFSEFGLTIVDEVHHISAEIFVRALQKIVTRFTLGLSATMNRKDGLSKVFKMFLGEIIHKEIRKDDKNVIVKAVQFSTSDEEFNRNEYDYRGNIQFATMIKKLCEFNYRSELILHIITKELQLNEDQQILILGHNKSLLHYLYKAIDSRKIESVGYYIGGMKQKDLKLSEDKKIIIATYSMAAEALDIKSLTSLVFVTPKVDIEQAVGRIMRMEHGKHLIIDIVDTHETFKKQWAKRKAFYLKRKYNILYTEDYKSDNWEKIEKKTTKKSEQVGQCLIKI